MGCNYGKIEVLVTGVGGGINSGVVWCVYGWLGTAFDRYSYGITLGIDKII